MPSWRGAADLASAAVASDARSASANAQETPTKSPKSAEKILIFKNMFEASGDSLFYVPLVSLAGPIALPDAGRLEGERTYRSMCVSIPERESRTSKPMH